MLFYIYQTSTYKHRSYLGVTEEAGPDVFKVLFFLLFDTDVLLCSAPSYYGLSFKIAEHNVCLDCESRLKSCIL